MSDFLQKLGEIELHPRYFAKDEVAIDAGGIRTVLSEGDLRSILLAVAEELENRICKLCQATLKKTKHFYADEYYSIHEVKECGGFYRLAQELKKIAEEING